jgi:hypothetical protein
MIKDKYNEMKELSESMTQKKQNLRPTCGKILESKNSWFLPSNSRLKKEYDDLKQAKQSEELGFLYKLMESKLYR